jgi:hypothetical protein
MWGRRSPPSGSSCGEITAGDYLQTDDTTITVLDERGSSYKGRLWTYLDPLRH